LEFDQSGWLSEESPFSLPAEGANGWDEISFASIQRFVGQFHLWAFSVAFLNLAVHELLAAAHTFISTQVNQRLTLQVCRRFAGHH
jgi:hypothetical protein